MEINNRIRGCLIGGAVGDALGYPVEFQTERMIFSRYGARGITEYEMNRSGEAEITDDTQMTLFTANGFLYQKANDTEQHRIRPEQAVMQAYFDWYITQIRSSREGMEGRKYVSWLRDVPGLYETRAPGNTCLSGIATRMEETAEVSSFLCTPINHSKGCGTVMRAAPAGLCYEKKSYEEIQILAAEISAVTHGHPLGYLPSSLLAHIVHEAVYGESRKGLKEIVQGAVRTMQQTFPVTEGVEAMSALIAEAIALAENDRTDLENIHALGEGWVADEALAIGVYCALRYEDDFTGAMIASVNHKGDSDSTGAVTGNILGAWIGYEAMDDRWKEKLELRDIILEIADDITLSCSGVDVQEHPDFVRKYVEKMRVHPW